MLVQVIKSIEDTKFNKMLMVRKSEYWCCQLLAWKSCRGKFPICNIIVVQSTKLYLPAGTFSINQICWCNGKAVSHTYIDSFPSLPQFALHHKHFVYALNLIAQKAMYSVMLICVSDVKLSNQIYINSIEKLLGNKRGVTSGVFWWIGIHTKPTKVHLRKL